MMHKITDRVYYLPHDDHGDRPVLGYIVGDRYALMIDAGNGKEHVALYNQGLADAGLRAPDFVALTHWHWDHVFGLHAVSCPSIASVKTNQYIADVARWSWSEEAMAKRLETGEDNDFCDREIRVAYPDRSQITVCQATLAFQDAMTIDLGGLICELRQFDNPHTADGVVFYLPQEKLVFLGDADCPGSHHGRAPLYKEKLAELYKAMRGLDFKTIVPGHDAPMTRENCFANWEEELRG